MNLKLFQQECAKRIVIVLRDFDERYDVKEKIQELIMTDINTIWKEIKKPEKFRDYTPDQFFEFEFTTLSHKFYFEDKFKSEVAQMRKRLFHEDPQYLFRHVLEEKTVPLDGLSIYCRQIWGDIISNKDLNIPSQKEMLANFKCMEIKDQALQTVNNEIESFTMDSSVKMLDNFKSRCEKIQKTAISVYDETAKNYLKYVYEEIRRGLLSQLSQRLYLCFDNQAKKLIPIFQKNMRNELEKELKNSKKKLKINFSK
jgi:protein SEY1